MRVGRVVQLCVSVCRLGNLVWSLIWALVADLVLSQDARTKVCSYLSWQWVCYLLCCARFCAWPPAVQSVYASPWNDYKEF